MKKLTFLAMACSMFISVGAQTLKVNIGDVTYAFPAQQTGDMLFESDNLLNICGKSFAISEISNMTVDQSSVTDNFIDVSYAGNSAKVVVPGNVAKYLTVKVDGGHVAVVADPNLSEKVTYHLTGNTSNGSFYMSGDTGITLMLDGVTLTNPDSAAINIQNGKMIKVNLVSGTSNYLSDGLTNVANDGSNAHNAAFYIDGHSSWTGSGVLTIAGNVKHAYSSDEYTLFEDGLGEVTVSSAMSDGLHINQYFQMKGGTVTISAAGDGIDVGAKKSDKENNGNLLIDGGTLTVSTTGDATKALKCDNNMVITGGTINASTSGNGIYESDENDVSSCACAKCDGAFTMSAGTLTLTSTGSGGKGINSTGEVVISGGTLTVVTTGSVYAYNSELDSKPHGVKCDTDITLSGGEILVCASSDSGCAFKTDFNVFTNGATMMGIGDKATTGSASSTHESKKYSGVKVVGGTTLTYDDVSFLIPSIYNNSKAKVIVSSPSM